MSFHDIRLCHDRGLVLRVLTFYSLLFFIFYKFSHSLIKMTRNAFTHEYCTSRCVACHAMCVTHDEAVYTACQCPHTMLNISIQVLSLFR